MQEAEKKQDAGYKAFLVSCLLRLFLLVLLLCSFGLHLWRLDAKSIWWDESLSLLRARGNVPYILSNRIDLPGSSTVDLHPPLYFLLLHILIRIGGESDFVLRFLSVAFAALIVPLLYAMGVRLRGPRAGLIAAFFGALSPFYLWYAQEARMYTMVTALGLASFYFLWRACTERKQLWGLAFGLAAAAAVATQYLSVLLLVCEGFLGYFLWVRRSAPSPRQDGAQAPTASPGAKRQRRSALYWGLAILLAILLPLTYRIVTLALWPKAGRWYVPLPIMLRDALNSFSLGISVELGEVWAFDVVFLLVYLVGVISLWRRPPKIMPGEGPGLVWQARGAGLVVLVAYILIPVLVMWLYSFFAPLYMGSRYVIMCSPAFYLGLGIGIDAVAHWRRALAVFLGMILVAGMCLSIYRYFNAPRYRNKEDYRSAAQYVEANEHIHDAILVTAPENIIAFTHYYQGKLPVIPVPSVSLSGGLDPTQVAEDLAALASSYERLWLVHCRTMFSDPKELVSQWLNNHAHRLEQRVLPGYGSFVTLTAYLPRWPVEPVEARISEPLGSFGSQVRLVTYTLRYADASGQAHQISPQEATHLTQNPIPAGGVVSVVLLWQPLDNLGVYKTSLRLVDSQGTIWAQRDRLPFERLPTSEWPVGARIRHEADLPVPIGTPRGTYRLELWLYEADNGRSLSFSDHNTRHEQPFLDLGQVSVGACKRRYSVQEFVPHEAQAVGCTTIFGGKLELLAFELAPGSARAGETVELRLYWRARKAVTQGCELVLNWEDAQGRIWRTTRHTLTGGDSVARDLQAGELVRGLLKLPTPGDAPRGPIKLHLLVFSHDEERFLWLRRGLLPYAGRDLELPAIRVE